jgi:tripartite-type tricarboxylate transporter receptor subunit TctC
MFAPPQTVAAASASGQVQSIAMTAERRSVLLPGIPTVNESGLPGYSAVGWFGLFGPRGMPAPVTAKIAAEAAQGITTDVTRQRLAGLGAEPEPMSPDAFARFIDADIAKWQQVVRERGITLE